jgi:hypothetical protein
VAALRQARSVVVRYANFMPGEAQPEADRGWLASIYDDAAVGNVAIGTPDLLPLRPFQQAHACRFMREKKVAGKLTSGIAVQDGNDRGKTGDTPEPRPGKTWPDLVPAPVDYAEHTLGTRYLFRSIQEPYFTRGVISDLSAPGR